MTFRFFGGRLDIEISWDHGPELWITVYGRRTQVFMVSYNAYPTLGGVKPYTIEDLYRDSPTETPFRKMVESGDDPDTRYTVMGGESMGGESMSLEPYAVNIHPPSWRPSDEDQP